MARSVLSARAWFALREDPGTARFALAPGYLPIAPSVLRQIALTPSCRRNFVTLSSHLRCTTDARVDGDRRGRLGERRRRGHKVARGECERSEHATPGSDE